MKTVETLDLRLAACTQCTNFIYFMPDKLDAYYQTPLCSREECINIRMVEIFATDIRSLAREKKGYGKAVGYFDQVKIPIANTNSEIVEKFQLNLRKQGYDDDYISAISSYASKLLIQDLDLQFLEKELNTGNTDLSSIALAIDFYSTGTLDLKQSYVFMIAMTHYRMGVILSELLKSVNNYKTLTEARQSLSNEVTRLRQREDSYNLKISKLEKENLANATNLKRKYDNELEAQKLITAKLLLEQINKQKEQELSKLEEERVYQWS
jgi:hypothetical protein